VDRRVSASRNAQRELQLEVDAVVQRAAIGRQRAHARAHMVEARREVQRDERPPIMGRPQERARYDRVWRIGLRAIEQIDPRARPAPADSARS